MLKPNEVIEKDYLEHRHMLIEIAAWLDRFDAAAEREGLTGDKPAKLKMIDRALEKLRQAPSPRGRAHDLLDLFAS